MHPFLSIYMIVAKAYNLGFSSKTSVLVPPILWTLHRSNMIAKSIGWSKLPTEFILSIGYSNSYWIFPWESPSKSPNGSFSASNIFYSPVMIYWLSKGAPIAPSYTLHSNTYMCGWPYIVITTSAIYWAEVFIFSPHAPSYGTRTW